MKIGVLIFKKEKERGTGKKKNYYDGLPYLGFNYILKEIKEYDFVDLSNIINYDYVLFSITSVYDVESLIILISKNGINKGKCKIIVGGAGCINITSIYDYIDIACYGRCEGQINDIMAGVEFDNVWRKDKDPKMEKIYTIRQAGKLLENEDSIGCKNKCLFCQYTWTREHKGEKNYQANWRLEENDLKSTKITNSGRYITAIDGFSEVTRLKVNKHITDDDFSKFLSQIYDVELSAPANVKLYSIIGYPWETAETVINDLKILNKVFKNVDRLTGKKRMLVMILLTPFSPSPITPMELCPANVFINWRLLLNSRGRNIYKGIDYECFILPQINSQYSLAKRVLIERCNLDTRDKVIKIINYKFKNNNDLFIAESIKYLGYNIYDKLDKPPVKWLKTYCNYKYIKVNDK